MLIFHSFVRLPEGVAVAHGDFLFFLYIQIGGVQPLMVSSWLHLRRRKIQNYLTT
jgi:hypothetical protein